MADTLGRSRRCPLYTGFTVFFLETYFIEYLKYLQYLQTKRVWDFPFSIPFRFYYSLYFCSIKCMDTLTLKRHNSFQNENNRKATHSFASRPLILKLQQEVLKFHDICVSWSSPKTDLVANLLNF